MFFTEIVRKK